VIVRQLHQARVRATLQIDCRLQLRLLHLHALARFSQLLRHRQQPMGSRCSSLLRRIVECCALLLRLLKPQLLCLLFHYQLQQTTG
jgi:hypothetical protein